MEKTTAAQIAEWTGGTLSGDVDSEITSVCISSADAAPGSMFVALRGENTDGHLYISASAQAGASTALVSRDVDCAGLTAITVPDTLAGLQAAAAGYKRQFPLRCVGVTGSVGKTTTKEFIYAVLCARYNTLKSLKNLNSETGMPLSVFNLSNAHQAAVFEMGMSRKGEIAALTRIARPDIAVITNIGVSHIEYLGSRENILFAKLEIERGLPRDGVMVLNGDDPMLWGVKGTLRHKTVYYAIDNPEAKFRAANIKADDGHTDFDVITPVGTLPARINTVGLHNVQNALAAVTVGLYSGISLADSIDALLSFENAGMRQSISEHGGVTLINDCYNASPDSMSAALTLLSGMQGRRIAVLSDMLELGSFSLDLHADVGRVAAGCCDILVTCGDRAANISAGAAAAGLAGQNNRHFGSRGECAQFLIQNARKGDIILFKGSRGMKTEQILDAFTEGWNV